ncbi:hypothetical protein [Clostridium sp.]|uniref:hypothetical protein n=1 Tax=Clostridium sp. TaxID=1506 RepID=UPI00262F6A4E
MILLKGLCLLLNIISLVFGIKLKRLVEKAEYIRENYEIRKSIISSVVTLILLIVYILSNNTMLDLYQYLGHKNSNLFRLHSKL